MPNIIEINTPTYLRPHVDWLKGQFNYLFGRLDKVDISIICDIPSITDAFGKISIMCLIDFPKIEGKNNYYSWNHEGKWRRLYSLCVGFRILYMAFTRAIDTLYIKLRTPQNEFSQKLLSIAEKCGTAEILRDPEPPSWPKELPF